MKRYVGYLITITVLLGLLSSAVLAAEKITVWSHWADELNKKNFVQAAVDAFLLDNPDYMVEVVWYQKSELDRSLSAALQSGRGPDIFYLESARKGYLPFAEAGYLVDLEKYIDYDRFVEPWAKEFAVDAGITYLWPLEAYMPLIYYNKEAFAQADVSIPARGYFTTEEFLDVIPRLKAAGYTPFSAGTMDRDWVAAIFPETVLLRFLGEEKWRALSSGALSWNDPQVVEALQFIGAAVDNGAYPKGIAGIKLGESHGVFFSGTAAMFPMKSFFAGRAFVPEDQGGMAENFPLGVMPHPAVEDGPHSNLNYMEVGGSYAVSAFSKHPDKAAELLSYMAKPEILKIWIADVKVQTGLKTEGIDMTDPYLQMISQAEQATEYVAGPFSLGMEASYRDAFFQTTGMLVAGQMNVETLIKEMEKRRP